MIEPKDLIIPGNSSIHNRLAINVPGAFDPATAEIFAARLAQLEFKSVIGAYDAVHLQQIHARIFQNLFPWAGQFRTVKYSSSLDVLFDRLARENRLKGLDVDAWSKRSAGYIAEITSIEPFIGGFDLASMEFFRELAGENDINLLWTNVVDEPFHGFQTQVQTAQSNDLRRILMLAVDPEPSRVWQGRSLEVRNTLEGITPLICFNRLFRHRIVEFFGSEKHDRAKCGDSIRSPTFPELPDVLVPIPLQQRPSSWYLPEHVAPFVDLMWVSVVRLARTSINVIWRPPDEGSQAISRVEVSEYSRFWGC